MFLQQRVFKRDSSGFAWTSYFWGLMLLPFNLPTGYVKLLIFHLLRRLFTKEFLLKRWTYWLLLSSLWILWFWSDPRRFLMTGLRASLKTATAVNKQIILATEACTWTKSTITTYRILNDFQKGSKSLK